MSGLIFALAAYGILTHDENLFIIGLIFIGFVVLGGMLLSPVFGRFWCGWLCPRGIFLDYTLGPISMNRKIPKILRSKGFKNLMVGVMVLMLGISLLNLNPFLRSTNPMAPLGGFLVLMCIATTIAMAAPLGIIYKPRTWCSFCPMGYIQSLLSRKRLLKIHVENCAGCRKCEKICPIELKVLEENSDCLNCMNCVDVCKKQSLRPHLAIE